MNRDEVVDLLTAISAYDNRKPNPASILAWGKAAELGRWTFQEALAAVHEHFLANTEYLMPAHVGNRIRDRRQDRAMRDAAAELVEGASPLAIEAAEQWLMSRNADGLPAADEGQRAAQLARLNDLLPTPRAVSEAEIDPADVRAARKVRCPWCGAQPYSDCSRPGPKSTTVRRAVPHPSRLEAANGAHR